MISTANILFENTDYLVLNKPSGIVVNLSDTTPSGTIQDFLNDHLSLEISNAHNMQDESEFVARSGIVHRLDKDTSGVMVVAKNPEIFSNLQAQFKSREVHKEYFALVYGEVKDSLIEIDAPTKRDPKRRTRYIVSKNGKEAFTRIHLVKTFKVGDENHIFSLLKCEPKTGRTHQIRVHLCALGHSIVADDLYAGAFQKRLAKKLGFTRMMLHAHKLAFIYKDEEVSYQTALDFLPEFLHYVN